MPNSQEIFGDNRIENVAIDPFRGTNPIWIGGEYSCLQENDIEVIYPYPTAIPTLPPVLIVTPTPLLPTLPPLIDYECLGYYLETDTPVTITFYNCARDYVVGTTDSNYICMIRGLNVITETTTDTDTFVLGDSHEFPWGSITLQGDCDTDITLTVTATGVPEPTPEPTLPGQYHWEPAHPVCFLADIPIIPTSTPIPGCLPADQGKVTGRVRCNNGILEIERFGYHCYAEWESTGISSSMCCEKETEWIPGTPACFTNTCLPVDTFLEKYCENGSLFLVYADGNCGERILEYPNDEVCCQMLAWTAEKICI